MTAMIGVSRKPVMPGCTVSSLKAVHAWHLQIHQDQIESGLRRSFDCRRAIAHAIHVKSAAGKTWLAMVCGTTIVIHHQQMTPDQLEVQPPRNVGRQTDWKLHREIRCPGPVRFRPKFRRRAEPPVFEPPRDPGPNRDNFARVPFPTGGTIRKWYLHGLAGFRCRCRGPRS